MAPFPFPQGGLLTNEPATLHLVALASLELELGGFDGCRSCKCGRDGGVCSTCSECTVLDDALTNAVGASFLMAGVCSLGVEEGTGTVALPASKLLPGELTGALALPGDGAASQPMPGASRVDEETGARVLPGMECAPRTLLPTSSRATTSEGDVCFTTASPF